jgi:type II secretory pathway component GspD/PulD (secretin)
MVLLLPCGARAGQAEAVEAAPRPPKRISLALESADVRAVVTALARALDINLIGGDQLSGTVTVRLDEAPGLRSLEMILNNAGFALVEVGERMYQIAPIDGEGRRRGALRVRALRLQYADTERAAAVLVPSVIPDASRIVEDPETRQLLIAGTEEDIAEAQRVLAAIDERPAQVAIQARFIEIFTDRAKKLGAKVTLAKATTEVDPEDGTTKTISQDYTFDLTQTMPAAADSFTYTLVGDKVAPGVVKGITATIDALAQKDAAQILSAPNVTASHGREATMKVVDQVPVITRSTTQVVDQVTVTDETVEFKEAGVTLTVTPRVVAGRRVSLLIEPSVKEVTGYTETDPPQPIIDTRTAKTAVMMASGQWLIIGGMIRSRERKFTRGIPLLKDIPLVGALFRTSQTTREKTNLIILVSTRVLDDATVSADARRVRERLDGHRRGNGLWPDEEPLLPPDPRHE